MHPSGCFLTVGNVVTIRLNNESFPTYFSIIFSALLFSCKGADKSKSPVASQSAEKARVKGQPPFFATNGTSPGEKKIAAHIEGSDINISMSKKNGISFRGKNNIAIEDLLIQLNGLEKKEKATITVEKNDLDSELLKEVKKALKTSGTLMAVIVRPAPGGVFLISIIDNNSF